MWGVETYGSKGPVIGLEEGPSWPHQNQKRLDRKTLYYLETLKHKEKEELFLENLRVLVTVKGGRHKLLSKITLFR
jgi:hypothetical protein